MSESSGNLNPGMVIAGRYELTAEVGRGGFGVVWRARQMNMDRDVAIKILPPRFLSIPDVVERFKREARLASRLRHPNTITLHDWGQSGNLLYIVMELLTGEDLADLLRRETKLDTARVIHITRQALKSLSEAHEQGIVHRDLKPENIFLSVVGDDKDVVKILDFGIAKLAQPQGNDTHDEKHRALTMSGSTVGTPTYMSPEQAAGESVDGQTDLYALGVIMYEMLDGRPPFVNRDPVKVMRSHLFDEVPPFRNEALNGTLLDRVVRKALAKERSDRFKSANEFLLALAADAVAKPVVFGLDLRSLDEPSTQEMSGLANSEADEPPNMQTLPFAATVVRNEDAIPFSNVPPKPQRELVRMMGDSSSSSLSDLVPPAAIVGATSTSSILRVIEPPPEEDVIVLTTKKSDDSAEKIPTAPRTQGDLPAARRATPQERDSWSWGENVDVSAEAPRVATGTHPTTPRRGWVWLVLVLVMLAAGIATVLLTPLGSALGIR